MEKKKLMLPALAVLALVAGGTTTAFAVAHADTTTPTTTGTSASGHTRGTPPAAMGTVTAVSGDSITLTDKKNNTTYTVDATNAMITKHSAPTTQGGKPTSTTISVSGIAVGDTLMVQGTVSGDTVTATTINDGMGFGGRGMGGGAGMHDPGVMGTVTAVNGSSVTVTGKNGTTYTVDASNSSVEKMETISVSDIAVGDTIGVQGTTTGSTVVAKNIMDGMPSGSGK